MVPRLLFRDRSPDHAQEGGQAQALAATPGRLPEGAGFSRRDTSLFCVGDLGGPAQCLLEPAGLPCTKQGERLSAHGGSGTDKDPRQGFRALPASWSGLEPSLSNCRWGSQRLPSSPYRVQAQQALQKSLK